ncbi:glycosyltransferase 87 family protein [Streptomyces purpureus]|uniref:Alpha-1,2-mannosyltransferase n=1 Tax=Streptomyces purpureus TaxID=1951 RepID=A0A918LWW1_9ACTN|nr:glycosyltransferase 87 family protein [Streptomyces purpureus]GGT61407.1 hypothetical protein GCM10014713_63610 [Streptomyces purpureus]
MTVSVIAKFRVRRRPLAAAAAACLLSFAGFWLAQRAAHVSMLDLMVYRAEGETVRAGGDLYAMRATSANLAMTYPPFAGLLFTPLTLLGVPEMRTLATAGNLLLVVALVHLSLRLVGRDRLETTLWAAAVLVWCEPVWTTLRYGQINLLIAVAVLWDLTRRDTNRWAGVGIGLATTVKLTPGLFAFYLLVVGVIRLRRGEGWNSWLRQFAVASATFLGATAASALILPYDSRRFWTETLFETGRVGFAEETANQSLRGVLARLMHTDDPGMWWAVAAALFAVAGLVLAVRAALRGDRAVAVVAVAVTALMISPISWSHHWVWCVPVLVLLVDRAAGWAWTAPVAFAFYSFALWWVPHDPGRPELDQNAGQMVLSAVYPLAAGAVMWLLAFRLPRGAGPGIEDGAAPAEKTGAAAQAVAKE